MIILNNTLTRKKENFIPLEEGNIKMYVCGPTVYDVPHIGHARSAYVFDVIRRYLRYSGFNISFVRNVTDIDDKIIKKAVDELNDIGEPVTSGRLKERVKEVAVRYLDVYHKEMDILGITSPDIEPKATENVENMIRFIEVLMEKGYAYESDGNVYFSVSKFSGYGKLSHQNKDQMSHGVRIGVDKDKKDPLDFVLWKKAKTDEPFWKSPWGPGRPGWHIECSVMSTGIHGETFDIHGGGLDLIFPHHENEIAQAEAATGKPFANYWIHNGLLFVDGEKMSKSLGNYVTINDFLNKYKDPDILKISFLNSHYRSAMDYSNSRVEESRRSKERIMIFFDKVDRLLKSAGNISEDNMVYKDPGIVERAQEIVDSSKEKFNSAMDDDFNTPLAMSVIFEAVKAGNDCLVDKDISEDERMYRANAVKNHILMLANILGLSLNPVKVALTDEEDVEKLVEARNKARSDKDYAKADEIRKELSDMGITIEDTPEGTVWRKS